MLSLQTHLSEECKGCNKGYKQCLDSIEEVQKEAPQFIESIIELGKRCPCQLCLVKSVCKEACPEFDGLIKEWEIKHKDEINKFIKKKEREMNRVKINPNQNML